jgi:hypothetical protein
MKINLTISTALLTGCLLAGLDLTAQAQITADYQTDGGSSTAFDSFITPNLIQAGQSSLASARADSTALGSLFNTAGLNDGSASGNGNLTWYSGVGGNGTVMPNMVTFQLTAGYNITNIQVISGWGDHNLGEQCFQVLLSIGGESFTSIGTFTNNTSIAPGNSGPGAWMTTVTGGTGGIATNVTGIEFIFLNPDTSNGSGHVGISQAGGGSTGGTLIHEVQVFGTFYASLTPAITVNYQSSSSSASAFDSSIKANLIQAGQSSLASATADSPALNGAFLSTGLNDGSAAASSSETYYEATPGNGTYMPNTAIFLLTAGYNITNIQVISGWGSGNLGEQAFQVLVSIGGGAFTNLGTFVNNTDVGSGNPGSWLTTLKASTGAIATNVTAIEFMFLNPDATKGLQNTGASQAGSGGTVVHEVQVFGTYYTNLPTAINLANVVQNNQTDASSSSTFDSFIAPNLIQAGQSSLGSMTADDPALDASFSVSGLNDGSAGTANLTYYSATRGNGTFMPDTAIFQLTAGYNITNIQVISGWSDHNLGEQVFQVLISIGGGAFTSIGTFNNNASINPGFGGPGASWMTTLTGGAGPIANNVTGIEFIFLNPDTSNGSGNVGSSQAGGGSTGGTLIHELQVFGSLYNATPVPPSLGAPRLSGGNLIVTGTGGTPDSGYTWLSTTNLTAPINWTTNSTGTLDGAGSFSNAIPINTSQPAGFFRLRLP